jgi:outer membrane protein OmpA-like peptidoglycan-associated protein
VNKNIWLLLMQSKNQVIADAFKSIREFLNTQQTRLKRVEEQVQQLEETEKRFQHIEKSVKKLNSLSASFELLEDAFKSLDQCSSRLLELEKSIENQEKILKELNSFKQIHQKLEKQQMNVAQTRTDVERVQNRIESLEKLTDKIKEATNKEILKITADLKGLDTRFNALETSFNLEEVHTRLENLEKFTDHLKEEIDEKQLKITANLNKLQTCFEDFKKQNQTLEQEKTQFSFLSKQIENLEQIKITQLVCRLSQLELGLVRLNDLEKQVNDTELRTKEIATVLPHAIRQASQSIDSQTKAEIAAELIDSLQKPVEQCIRQSIRQDIRPFVEALFPVIGPVIRKSLNELFKTLIQSINKSLEQSLSWQGLSWRIEAWRCGRPFSEIVLQHTLVYRVEQVFLIHRESGLLIQHVHQEDIEIGDSDAVSAMFTAIQDFIRDSFLSNKIEELDSVEIGEYTVWLERGPYAVLACVIRGVAPYEFRNLMRSTIESLHADYGPLLKEFSGNCEQLQACQFLLEKTLRLEKKFNPERHLLHPNLIIIFSLIILLFGGLGYWHFQYQERLSDYIETLRKRPGIVVISTGHQDGKLLIYGMRDPLADDPQDIAQDFELNDHNIVSQWIPYLDLTPPFLERRMRQRLAPPATVNMQLQGDVLHLTGYAQADWIEKAKKTSLVTGINHLEINALIDVEQRLLAKAQHELALPNGVILTMQEGLLKLTGLVDSKTYHVLQQNIQNFLKTEKNLLGFDTSALINAEFEIQKYIQRIENTNLYFSDGTKFREGQEITFQSLLKDIEQLLIFSQALDKAVHILIIGDTDGRGSKIHNQELSQQRAEFVANLIHKNGIEKDILITTLPTVIRFGENKPHPNHRKVHFQLK